jgi:hypothetical protein
VGEVVGEEDHRSTLFSCLREEEDMVWFGTEEVTTFRLLSLFHVSSDFLHFFYSLATFF